MALGPLSSMTGFGRGAGTADAFEVNCEIRSVNGRGLDIRTRLAPGLEVVEAEVRRLVGERMQRGSLQVQMALARNTASAEIVVNLAALETVLEAIAEVQQRIKVRRPSAEGILALKGILDTRDSGTSPEAEAALLEACRAALSNALDGLVVARREEGERIGSVIAERLDEIARLAHAAEIHPSRTREAIQARLTAQLQDLSQSGVGLSEDRLAQEALLLATKADIREELDRLSAHIAAARSLLATGGPVGRKFDFLAQEFNREANTLCSKSNDVGLTGIGLDLKAAIDQLREQVQNLE